MTGEELEEVRMALAQAIVDHQNRIYNLVEKVPDESLPALVELCLREPRNTMDCWEFVASSLRSEMHFRRDVRKFNAYVKATGRDDYCPACEGACSPEHQAQLRDE